MSRPELIEFEGQMPSLGDDVFVAAGANVIGGVEIGAYSSIWFNTVVRGDVYPITIGERTNLQDSSVVHVTGGEHETVIGDEVTIGHSATIHGCQIGDRCLVGMGATVLDGAEIGEESLIAAGALIPPGMRVPSGSLVMGSPGVVKRELNVEERVSIKKSADHYVELAARHRAE